MIGRDETDIVDACNGSRDGLGILSFLRGLQASQGERGDQGFDLLGLVEDCEIRTRTKKGISSRHGY